MHRGHRRIEAREESATEGARRDTANHTSLAATGRCHAAATPRTAHTGAWHPVAHAALTAVSEAPSARGDRSSRGCGSVDFVARRVQRDAARRRQGRVECRAASDRRERFADFNMLAATSRARCTLPADCTAPAGILGLERQATDRGRRLRLDRCLALGRAAPAGDRESAAVAEKTRSSRPALRCAVRSRPGAPTRARTAPAGCRRASPAAALRCRRGRPVRGSRRPDAPPPPARPPATLAQLDPQRHALHLPLEELRARPQVLPVVDLDAQPCVPQLRRQGVRTLAGRAVLTDRDHDHLVRRDRWGRRRPRSSPWVITTRRPAVCWRPTRPRRDGARPRRDR